MKRIATSFIALALTCNQALAWDIYCVAPDWADSTKPCTVQTQKILGLTFSCSYTNESDVPVYKCTNSRHVDDICYIPELSNGIPCSYEAETMLTYGYDCVHDVNSSGHPAYFCNRVTSSTGSYAVNGNYFETYPITAPQPSFTCDPGWVIVEFSNMQLCAHEFRVPKKE